MTINNKHNNLIKIECITKDCNVHSHQHRRQYKQKGTVIMANTMFRQAFFLSQYTFICEQYFKCSDT